VCTLCVHVGEHAMCTCVCVCTLRVRVYVHIYHMCKVANGAHKQHVLIYRSAWYSKRNTFVIIHSSLDNIMRHTNMRAEDLCYNRLDCCLLGPDLAGYDHIFAESGVKKNNITRQILPHRPRIVVEVRVKYKIVEHRRKEFVFQVIYSIYSLIIQYTCALHTVLSRVPTYTPITLSWYWLLVDNDHSTICLK
jgi:hypothetical protein